MATRNEPSAAQALFGHLPSAVRPEVNQRHKPTTAQSLYPGMRSLAPKPQRRYTPDELKTAWFEWRMEMVGFRRKR